MNKNILTQEDIRQLLEARRYQRGQPHPRDILRRKYDEAQKRPNEALEQWGPIIEENIERALQAERFQRTTKKDELDLDMG